MLRNLLIAAAVFAGAIPSALAQDGGDEIVVTATRYRDAYEDFSVPHVALVRRADFAIQEITIGSDTRDTAQRSAELRQALQALTRHADRAQRTSVALIEEDDDESGEARVIAFTVDKAMESLHAGARADTSYVTITVRTRVAPEDDLDSVEERLEQFVGNIPRPGRVEVSFGEMQLTLSDPQQYRPQIIAAITGDASQIAGALGQGYGARLEGLENPIAWRRAGDIDLRLFIPYRMVVLPRTAY